MNPRHMLPSFARKPISLDLDDLERDHLVDRVRSTGTPGCKIAFSLNAPPQESVTPIAITIVGAWLVDATVRGRPQLYAVHDRFDAEGVPLDPELPRDLIVGPDQLDPARNGRRGWPVAWDAIARAWTGDHLCITVFVPYVPSNPETVDVVVTLYGVRYEPSPLPECCRPPFSGA